jgi:hypothetical protein
MIVLPDWRIGMYGFPMALWLMVGWCLLLAGAGTLVTFLVRLLWFSLGDLVVQRFALTAPRSEVTAREQI